MLSKWLNEKENLEKLIFEEKLSYEEIGRRYGCSGGNIRKVAKQIGLLLPVKRKINPNETFNKGLFRLTKGDEVLLKNTANCINCGINFTKKTGYSNKYCCSECEKEYKHKQKYLLILDGDPSIMRANYSPKNFKLDIIKEQNGICAICGIKEEWNNKPLVFIIDHIDGHASNNKRENLRCICPNCDSQLDTYKSKNKNGERSYYRYHKDEKV